MSAEEDEHDAHLKSALRHAPDAALGPPAALSQAILHEARAKARAALPLAAAAAPGSGARSQQATTTQASGPRPRAAWLAAWDWLARPAVATGFASLMVALVLGLMWWDSPLKDEMAAPPRPERARTEEAAVAPASPVAAAPEPSVPPAAPKAQPEVEAAQTRAAAQTSARPKPAAPAQNKSVAKDDVAQKRQALAPPRPAPQPPDARPSPSAPAAEAEAAQRERTQDSNQAAAAPSSSSTLRFKAAAAARAPALADAPNRANTAGVATAAGSEPSVLAALRASITAEPAAWTWQRADGEAHSMDDAVLAWLARVDAATHNGWQARSESQAPSGGRELRLIHQGRALHVLSLTGDAVLWSREGAKPMQASLPPATLSALQAGLDAAAP